MKTSRAQCEEKQKTQYNSQQQQQKHSKLLKDSQSTNKITFSTVFSLHVRSMCRDAIFFQLNNQFTKHFSCASYIRFILRLFQFFFKFFVLLLLFLSHGRWDRKRLCARTTLNRSLWNEIKGKKSQKKHIRTNFGE